MTFLKWFGLAVLSVLLFISLSFFGIAFTVKSTVLNPGFVTREIDRVPLSTLVNDVIANSSFTSSVDNGIDITPKVKTAIEQTVAELEPELKQEVGFAVTEVYDYLLGKKPAPELAVTLHNTVLSDKFVTALIDKLPLATLASNIIDRELEAQNVPLEALLLKPFIPPALSQAEPLLKEQLKTGAPQIIDYLLGNTKTLNVTLNLQPVIDSLRNSAIDLLLDPPPAIAILLNPALQAQINANPGAYIDTYFGAVLDEIPATFTLDETSFGSDTPSQIADGLNQAENALSQVKPYITLYNTYFIWFIIFMLILIGGIIAIDRSIRGSTRWLGSIFLAYGVLTFAIVLIGRYLSRSQMVPWLQSQQFGNGVMPPELVSFVRQLVFDATSTLFYFSLGILIVGVVLFVVSFVYHSRRPVVESSK